MSHSCHRYLFYIEKKVSVRRLKKKLRSKVPSFIGVTGARQKFWGQFFSEIHSFLSPFSPKICTWKVAKIRIWFDKYIETTLIWASRDVYLDIKVMPYDFFHYETFSVITSLGMSHRLITTDHYQLIFCAWRLYCNILAINYTLMTIHHRLLLPPRDWCLSD